MKNQINNLKFKSTFFLVGINLALGLVLALFNWTTAQGKVYLQKGEKVDTYFPPFVLIEEEIEASKREESQSQRTDKYEIDEDFTDKLKDNPIIKTNKKFAINLDSFLKHKKEKTPEIPLVTLEDTKVYKGLDAKFVGGSFQEFVKNQIRVPGIVKEVGLVGSVVVQFVVEKDGAISDVRVVTPKEHWMGYGVEQACLNVVQLSSGKWKPGKYKNKRVRTLFRLPIEIDYSGF